MGKEAAVQPRVARSTRGVPPSKFRSDEAEENQNPNQGSQRKSRTTKAAPKQSQSMTKGTTQQPPKASSTAGKRSSKATSSAEVENQTPSPPKAKKRSKRKAAGDVRKTRLVKLKVPLYFVDFYEGKTAADWEALSPQHQREAQKKIEAFLADKGQLQKPNNWVSAEAGLSAAFSWSSKTPQEQTAAILRLAAETKQRKKTRRSSLAAARQAGQAEAAALAVAAALLEGEAEDGGGGGGGGEEGGGGGGGGGDGGGDGAAGEGLEEPVAHAAPKLDRRTRDVRNRKLQLHLAVALVNERLQELQVPGGPVTQLMLVEVEDQADANTGGGSTAASKRDRPQRLLRVTALPSQTEDPKDVPKYLGGLLKNAFSDQPAKKKAADCEMQYMSSSVAVASMIKADKDRRSREATVNHHQALATMVDNGGLPMPVQAYGPTHASVPA
jgi:hypothetical protein